MATISRRDAIKGLLTVGAGGWAVLKKESRSPTATVFDDEPKYGFISAVDNPCFRAYLNDIDVSAQCFEADDRQGYVGLYEMNQDGHIVWPLRELYIYGDVRIEPDV